MSLSSPLLSKLLITALLVLAGMVLWGGVDRAMTWRVIGLLIAVRLIALVRHWIYRPPPEADWMEIQTALVENLLAQNPGWTINDALESTAYRQTLASLEEKARPRDRRDLGLEAVSLLLVVPASLLLVLMLTEPVVTFTGIARWTLVLGMAAGIALHFAPLLIGRRHLTHRLSFRITLIAVVAFVTGTLTVSRHDYLLKTGAERRESIARKVWALGVGIPASGHSEDLFAYADDLVATGRLADAVTVYERGLEVDPHNQPARQKLSVISKKIGISSRYDDVKPESAASRNTRLWVAAETVTPVRVMPDPPSPFFSLVLVPVGDVPPRLLDRLAAELTSRIRLPVYRYATPVPLPPPDRTFGVIGGRQWHPRSLQARFLETRPTKGALQYLIVTPHDLFIDDSNYVFGASGGMLGYISYARFHSSDAAPENDGLLIDRLAKQVLSTSIKGFGLTSPNTDCVTTFCRDLTEFDLKSQLPSDQIGREYLNAIRALEDRPRTTP